MQNNTFCHSALGDCVTIDVVAQFIGLLNDFVDEPHK